MCIKTYKYIESETEGMSSDHFFHRLCGVIRKAAMLSFILSFLILGTFKTGEKATWISQLYVVSQPVHSDSEGDTPPTAND